MLMKSMIALCAGLLALVAAPIAAPAQNAPPAPEEGAPPGGPGRPPGHGARRPRVRGNGGLQAGHGAVLRRVATGRRPHKDVHKGAFR